MRRYQKRKIVTLLKMYRELSHNIVMGFHKDQQEKISMELEANISSEGFLEKHKSLIIKYERQLLPDWNFDKERTVATKIKSFWQKLDEEDADYFIVFLNEAIDHVSLLSKHNEAC